MFVALLSFLFVVCLFFSFFEEERDNPTLRWAFYFLSCSLFLLAAFRPIGVDLDSKIYVEYFHDRTNSDFTVEPSFQYIAHCLRLVSQSPDLLFVVYAFLSIPLLIFAAQRFTATPYLTLAVWLSNYYILQNLTQIRVAVSEALFIFALPLLLQHRRWAYLLLIAIAIIFHYSAAFFLIGLFFTNRALGRWERLLLFMLPVASFALAVGEINFLEYIPIPYIQERLRAYTEMNKTGAIGGEAINYFNIPYLLKLTTFYFLLWKYEVVHKQVSYLPIILRIYACSIFFYVIFSFLPILASRISELFGIVEIFLVPLIVYAIRPRSLGRILVNIYAMAIFLFNVFYQKLLQL